MFEAPLLSETFFRLSRDLIFQFWSLLLCVLATSCFIYMLARPDYRHIWELYI